MALYSDSCRQIMTQWLRRRLKPGQAITGAEIRRYMRQNYPKFKENTIQCHIILLTTNNRTRVHYHPAPGRDDVLFRLDRGRFRLYDPAKDPRPIHRRKAAAPRDEALPPDEVPPTDESPPSAEGVPQAAGQGQDAAEEFPELRYEADLRDFLARNLDRIEPGLRPYVPGGEGGPEFPVEEGRIDLLAVDASGDPVVIELKAVPAKPEALAQLLYYMGWVEQNLAGGRKVRGMIIAREVSEKLRVAARKVPDVALFTYEIQVTLNKVQDTGRTPPARPS
jgi:hypothetical protein